MITFLVVNSKDPENDNYSGRLTLSIGFTIVGIIFGITGYLIMKVLKRSFPIFY